MQNLAHLPHSSSSESSEKPPSLQLTGSDQATTETYSPPDQFTPSHHSSSLSSTDPFPWYSDESMSTPYSTTSGGSLSSHYLSTSEGPVPSHGSISMPSHESISEGSTRMHSLESISGGSMPSQHSPHLTPDWLPPSPSSPPAEMPPEGPDNAEFFNKNMFNLRTYNTGDGATNDNHSRNNLNTVISRTVDPDGYVSAPSHLSSRHINNPSDKHSDL